ncbi:unnamed protein product [Citrullus colocynthis]|uniref:AAA-type ATPase N-terminal domain-containing protein n=1 Tax=Citrullus colocynthis TaxID=252529 RepID=A0ABP0YL89_9ROSI
MFGLNEMMPQSAPSLFAAYASFATTAMMIRSMTTNLLPPKHISLISSIFFYFFPPTSTLITTLVIDKNCDFSAEIYLRTKINPSMDRLKVSKTPRQNTVALSMEKGQTIIDHFQDSGDSSLHRKRVILESAKRSAIMSLFSIRNSWIES